MFLRGGRGELEEDKKDCVCVFVRVCKRERESVFVCFVCNSSFWHYLASICLLRSQDEKVIFSLNYDNNKNRQNNSV